MHHPKLIRSARPRLSRRQFVASAAAVAGAAGLAGFLPDKLAAAAAARPASFDLSQVRHLVFLMQENRSFDHIWKVVRTQLVSPHARVRAYARWAAFSA